jgi:hypothetical protein
LDEGKAMALMLREQFPATALAESAFPLSPSIAAFIHVVPSLVSTKAHLALSVQAPTKRSLLRVTANVPLSEHPLTDRPFPATSVLSILVQTETWFKLRTPFASDPQISSLPDNGRGYNIVGVKNSNNVGDVVGDVRVGDLRPCLGREFAAMLDE